MNQYLTILFLFVASFGFSQSKKELRADIAKQNSTIDSLQQQLVIESRMQDSIVKVFVTAQQNYLRQIQITNDLTNEYGRCQQKVNQLEQENAKLKSEKEIAKPKTPAKEAPKNYTNKVSTKNPKTNPFDNNPFAGSGSGNIGNDEGKGSDARTLIQKPNTSEIDSDEYCTIVFAIIIDENGKVIGVPEVVRGRTTTENTALIKKVSALVQSQTKYNPVKWAKSEKKEISVMIEGK